MFYVPRRQCNFQPLLRTLFRSEEFYADSSDAQPDQKPRAMAGQLRAHVGQRPCRRRLLSRGDDAQLSARTCFARPTSRAGTAA